MPSDLVAAARSRSADVSEAPTLSIGGAHRANVTSPPPAAHAPAAAPTVATAHVLGNPALHVGTVLRLRMDGPINAISGGAAGGNTLVIRMPGRRAVDHAAPLVHQDTRLVNAGVFNRAGNSELTLRFRDGLPAYAARAHGNALEIVLAPPAHRTALPAVVVRAPAHAPTQRAHVPASRAAHIPRRR
jgi:hypothetical protein